MNADKLASFRIDSKLWEQFQGYAKENNTNASALLVAYIKSVVNTGNVNTSSEVNNPSLSIQNIDNCIDDKVKQSIQNINTLSIQDIDNRIIESLADGDIKDAIANSYKAAMGQFNGLFEELQELKKQFEELKLNPPAAVPSTQSPINNGELTIDNYQLPDVESDLTSDTQSTIIDEEQAEKNRQSHEEYVQKYLTPKPEKPRLDPAIYTRNYQIVSMLDCQFWMDGKRFSQQDLKDNEIDKNIARNKAEIETLLETPINTKNSAIQRFVGILKAMGFKLEGNPTDGYYIANPEIFN